MDAEDIDLKKRDFLVKATSAMGLVGVAAVAVPFVSSMMPSDDVEAAGAPLRVKISDLAPGQQRTVLWRGKPVWIVRRTSEELATLTDPAVIEQLRDPESTVDQQPEYARNQYRSIKPEYLVLVGVCTHLGCVPTYRPDPKSITPDWEGGFYCSCHGSKYDMSGRVFKGVPAPINMQVPNYTYINEDEILLGVDEVPKTA
ncbi:MAG: ubiquinol-cytochrome c reductase iron-sulfur subunit [Pseudomonadota bacterium]|nr:ubiquinol-cytochrome c reductase iron-sulfur subunit [Pseudomonadota bacterium]